MNQETNHTILKKAVTRLPMHQPPDEIWSAIDNALHLQKGIQQLPQHQPAESIWQTIELDLAKSVSSTQSSGSTRRLFWIKRMSIAASFLLLVGMCWWSMNKFSNSNQFHYSQELINTQLLIADWDEDAEVFTQIEAICQTKTYVCSAPEFQELEQELQELNAAKLDLKQAINDFGKDTQLIAQLSEVELERTVILKKMIANIL